MLIPNPVKLIVKITHCSQGINPVQLGSKETCGPTDNHCTALSPHLCLSAQVILSEADLASPCI